MEHLDFQKQNCAHIFLMNFNFWSKYYSKYCIMEPLETLHIVCIDPCTKNMTQVNWKFLLMKSSKKYSIFLPAFYPIMVLMISPKNFEKIAILKIWQLFSSELSKLTSANYPWKKAFSGMTKIYLHQYCPGNSYCAH